MSLWVCQHGHNHETCNVVVSTGRGRKFHCPDVLQATRKYVPDQWAQKPLTDALRITQACSFCFASPGPPVKECEV